MRQLVRDFATSRLERGMDEAEKGEKIDLDFMMGHRDGNLLGFATDLGRQQSFRT